MALGCVVCCDRVGVQPAGDATKKSNRFHLQLPQKSPAIVATGCRSTKGEAPFLLARFHGRFFSSVTVGAVRMRK